MEVERQGNRIRVLLLANQALFRASLGRFLAADHNLEVVAECGDPAEALQTLGPSTVHVVLFDFDDRPDTRHDLIPLARRNGYQGRFLAITGEPDMANAALAVKSGAAGIFFKSEAPERLVQAITMVANGAVWLDQRILDVLAKSAGRSLSHTRTQPNPLPDREQQVLSGILSGLTNKKIAENLGLSEGAVKTSVQQLFMRAGVRRRSQLVRAALEGSF